MINAVTNEIICVSEAKGAVHDFELLKSSKIRISAGIIAVLDKGYIGFDKIHKNSIIPFKKPKNGELTAEQKKFNRKISSFRIVIEHVNRRIKRFKILSHRYRNKQKKHLLRVSLICGVFNFELGF